MWRERDGGGGGEKGRGQQHRTGEEERKGREWEGRGKQQRIILLEAMENIFMHLFGFSWFASQFPSPL